MFYILEKINLKKKKNKFEIKYNDKDIKILLSNIKIPFGIENYGRNLILNIELDKTKNNDIHNSISMIEKLENYVKNLNLENNTYVSSIKERESYLPLLRTNIKKYGKKIITKVKCNSGVKTLYDLQKNQNISILLIPDNIWLYNGKYGINWLCEIIYL
jgi:hypothetical protein